MSDFSLQEVKCVLTDPRGKQVKFYAETWHNHIVKRHPEMSTRYDDVKQTVEDPDHIREGRKPETEELYVRESAAGAVFVSTRDLDENSATIVTSAYSGRDKASRGQVKWRKPQ